MSLPRLNPAEIAAAARRIAPHVRVTPVISVDCEGTPVELKLEFLQVSGTFKARGAFNRLLAAREQDKSLPAAGIVAASGGNHGIAVAHAARALGVPANIFVPATAPAAKVVKLRALGAVVHAQGEQYADALAASEAFASRSGALRSHAYDQFETLAGAGTVALEWVSQSPALDTVLVAVGGGGLIGGMAAFYRSTVRVVAVESQGCPTLHAALAAGHPVDIEVGGLAVDSLGARRVGSWMFPIAQAHVATAVLVSDAAITAAQRWAWASLRIASEPGGAAALAALLSGAYQPAAGERVGVLMCGANVDPATLSPSVAHDPQT